MPLTLKRASVHRQKEDFFTLYKYKTSHFLGKGSFGKVVLATAPKKKTLAIKMTPRWTSAGQPKDVTHFAREARAISSLEHRCLVKAHGSSLCPRYVDIVMDYYPNGTLDQNVTTLDWNQVCTFSVDIACGVFYLHQNGIIHQDIKDDNILISASNHAVLSDLGTVQKVTEDSSRQTFGNHFLRAPEMADFETTPFCPYKAEMFTVGIQFWKMALRDPMIVFNGKFLEMFLATLPHVTVPDYMIRAVCYLVEPEPESRWSCLTLLQQLHQDLPSYRHVISQELDGHCQTDLKQDQDLRASAPGSGVLFNQATVYVMYTVTVPSP